MRRFFQGRTGSSKQTLVHDQNFALQRRSEMKRNTLISLVLAMFLMTAAPGVIAKNRTVFTSTVLQFSDGLTTFPAGDLPVVGKLWLKSSGRLVIRTGPVDVNQNGECDPGDQVVLDIYAAFNTAGAPVPPEFVGQARVNRRCKVRRRLNIFEPPSEIGPLFCCDRSFLFVLEGTAPPPAGTLNANTILITGVQIEDQ